MKRCPRCQVTKPFGDFYKHKKRKDGVQGECKACQCDRFSKYFANSPEQRAARAKRLKVTRARNRTNLYNYLLAHSCVDCGEADPIVLDFDHLSDKTENISRLVRKGVAWATVLAEIAKCEVVCSNCHRRRTARRHGGWFRSGIPQYS